MRISQAGVSEVGGSKAGVSKVGDSKARVSEVGVSDAGSSEVRVSQAGVSRSGSLKDASLRDGSLRGGSLVLLVSVPSPAGVSLLFTELDVVLYESSQISFQFMNMSSAKIRTTLLMTSDCYATCVVYMYNGVCRSERPESPEYK